MDGMEGTINEAILFDGEGHGSVPDRTLSFLKRIKVPVSAIFQLVEQCKQKIRDDGVDVVKVGLKQVQDVEEPDLEYLKIMFVLRLPFEEILDYQEKFYQAHLEKLVSIIVQKRGAAESQLVSRFMQHINISFDDSLS
jgi:hypothetical protein